MVARTLPITLAIASCVAFTTPAAPQGLLDFFKSILPAQTFEHVRTKTKQGYGAQVHGKIKISGKSFDFVSGGRGRGSAPFGTYRVGTLSGFKAPRGTWVPGYRLSDAYDPFVKDTRRGLFIHPGHEASAGCLAIRKAEWPAFVKAMQSVAQAGGNLAINLGPESEPIQGPVG
ncbi:MAG: L,D-transpeptidase [Rhodomicrobium sp.]